MRSEHRREKNSPFLESNCNSPVKQPVLFTLRRQPLSLLRNQRQAQENTSTIFITSKSLSSGLPLTTSIYRTINHYLRYIIYNSWGIRIDDSIFHGPLDH
jgi:hypothetical protein